MKEKRKFVIVGSIVLLIILTIVTVIAEKTPAFYWGIPIGIVFGIIFCIYLSKAWDPYLLEPTNLKTKQASWNIVWVVPLGIVVAEIMSKFSDGSTGQYMSELYAGGGTAWIFITFSYLIIQVWRYR